MGSGRAGIKKLIKQSIKLYKNKDPYLFKRIKHLIYCDIVRFFTRFTRPKGIKIENERWDYLIVLDACRFDVFEKVYRDYFSEGKLLKKISLGVETKSWLRRNFQKRNEDIVYISANPFVNKHRLKDMPWNSTFHEIIEAWKHGWDENLETTLPEAVVEQTLKAQKKYPNKRFISHFIQPHTPYVGEFRIKIKNKKSILDKEVNVLMDEVKFGNSININDVKKAYESNLRLALKEIQKMIVDLDGLIVVTADHGEMFGEKGFYFHPIVYTKELLEVPWLVIDNTKKSKIKKTTETIIKKMSLN